MAQLQDVVVLLRNGKKIKGRLQFAFNPQKGEVVIACRGEVENISLDKVCCISFLLNPEAPRYKKLPTEVVEHIVTVSGDEFVMRVLPNEMELDGFMATPQEENTPVQRVYFVSAGVKSRELTDTLGSILDQEKIADRGSIDQALDKQKELRSHRVGDILVNEGKVRKEDIERNFVSSERPGRKKLRMRVGEVLVSEGLITEEQLEEALQKQMKAKGKRIGEILIDSGVITEEAMLIAMAIKLRLRFIDLSHITPSLEALNMITPSMARKYMVLPIFMDDKRLVVAFSDPGNLRVIDDISFHTDHRAIPAFATKKQVNELIEQFYGEGRGANAEELDIELSRVEEDENPELEQTQISEAEQAPIVRLANRTIYDGVNAKASDIHIFPVEGGTRIDFRVNGLLQQYMLLSSAVLRPLVSRIKIVSGMDISERRLPQDGRIQMRTGNRDVEFRVSVMPDILGESVVLRILDKGNKPLTLDELGLTDEHAKTIDRIIHSANGFFLVTGPTGSGKSTTLLAAMSSLTSLPKRLISIEDPVEGKLAGVNQIQINSNIGFTFAKALRNLLRHDPDIVMVGEIRDQETAEIAVEAAMTGHMLLSSLHTNDAAGAFPRLINLGVEPFLVADTVKGVMAQHLIPQLCAECRHESSPDPLILDQLRKYGFEYDGFDFKSSGCKACHNSGVSGRVLVYELLEVNEEISRLVALNSSETEIKKAARKASMGSMAGMALGKAKEGLISLDYVLPLLTTMDIPSDN